MIYRLSVEASCLCHDVPLVSTTFWQLAPVAYTDSHLLRISGQMTTFSPLPVLRYATMTRVSPESARLNPARVRSRLLCLARGQRVRAQRGFRSVVAALFDDDDLGFVETVEALTRLPRSIDCCLRRRASADR
jgi:hypothetical protein